MKAIADTNLKNNLGVYISVIPVKTMPLCQHRGFNLPLLGSLWADFEAELPGNIKMERTHQR
ncbi:MULTISPECIES: hypothetical protein [Photorhabdus]|uniref:hypothetical protein n=1 Tax=Photorhabdus TaxID=29487 RepID=UPI00059E2C62|nr:MULTISPECIES: hypothetical protein [Photorhabdus]RAW72222.1 hypothetical protein CKY15_07970 [Photorhabdus sp. S7-51]AWK43246.1 hypothetical protein A4R40_17975 [Photorhabdus laumondii subsp. laumondii]AXG43907.1 hypothetical protein PluDJC_17765 [Photorhabdus laumondii subsp. laumondii]AXG48564.1 hypothetical protein PluTT01m_18590 [Photorhabdus laumondii subsp. laumondii]KTL60658.1 hypothetical protein AA106_02455 [Photorhabdus laumondii subsp. laumondii]